MEKQKKTDNYWQLSPMIVSGSKTN